MQGLNAELFQVYLADFPVHIPLLHVGEPPCRDRISCGHIYPYQPVIGHPKHIILLASFKPEKNPKTFEQICCAMISV